MWNICNCDDNEIFRWKKNPYELAGEIFEIACKVRSNGAESISNIGEIFDVNNYEKLIDEITIKLLDNTIKFNCEIQKFNNSKEMMDKIKTAIDNNKYIIFPYISNDDGKPKESVKEDNTPMHWCVINGYIDQGKVLFKETSKKLDEVTTNVEDLFKSNESINEKFNWNKYYNNKILYLIIVFFRSLSIKKMRFYIKFILQYIRRKKVLCKKYSINTNVKYMMITVEKYK